MRYISTRGQTSPQSFESVLLSGLAPDGGLFMPQSWPHIGKRQISSFADAPYVDAAMQILLPFVGGTFSEDELHEDVAAAYSVFDDESIAPLHRLCGNIHLLELFHGPTLAFKDIAMQLLGRLLARLIKRQGTFVTIVAATSGDTGSAAIAALGGLEGINLFVLHPRGRVSEIQRRQMTTAHYDNVHNIALEGSFDEAQAIVKTLFSDTRFSAEAHLCAVNSINFARIAAQCVYYFTAAAHFDSAPVFVVPTGNFGDVFAGEAAMRMGLGIGRLVVATNANDILCRALRDGVYSAGPARQTLSPSMDIQVASNFERALFESSGRDGDWTGRAMAEFAASRSLTIPDALLSRLQSRYSAWRCSDEETLATMRRLHCEIGRLVDPHTAVAVAAAFACKAGGDAPIIVLSTAHPGKFPDAVYQATGIVSPLPPRLADLYEGEERVTILPADVDTVRTHIQERLTRQ